MMKPINTLLLESTRKERNKLKYQKLLNILQERGFTAPSALYLVRYAEAIYALGNDRSKFKNFEIFLDLYFKDALKYTKGAAHEIKSLLKDPDTQIKYPVAFVELVMNVFHSTKFLANYKVNVDPSKGTIEFEERPKNDSDEIDRSIDPENPKDDFERRLVKYAPKLLNYFYTQDDNWITFKPRTPTEAQPLRTFYLTLYGDDYPAIKHPRFADILCPTWCILSSNKSMFNSQKADPARDSWYITFSKRHILDLIAGLFSAQLDSDGSTKEVTREDLLGPDGDLDYERIIHNFTYYASRRNELLGEAFLSSAKTVSQHSNVGVHNFQNSPGSAIPESLLVPKKSYDYPENIYSGEQFNIEGGVLIGTIEKPGVHTIKVPLGVTEIAGNAFAGINNVTTVILPPSVRTIKSDAFSGMPVLNRIILNDTLEVVETNGFKLTDKYGTIRRLDKVVIGVPKRNMMPESQDDVRRPLNLKYIPKIYDNFLFGVEDEAPILKDEKYELRRELFINRDGLLVENGCLVALDKRRMPEDSHEVYELPEGIISISNTLNMSNLPKKIVFPRTLTSIPTGTFNDTNILTAPTELEELDFSKCNISVIPDGAFANNKYIKKIILPNSTRTIGNRAFHSATDLETVVIPASVTNISRSAFGNNIALKNIVTDNKDELLKKLKSLYTKVDRNGVVIVDEEGNPAVYKIYDLFEAFVKERED